MPCWPKTIKQTVILPAEWAYSVTEKNRNSGNAGYGEPQASPETKGEECSFIEKGGVGRSCYKRRVHWRKLAVQRVVAFHWQSCDSFSLAGLSLGEEKSFLLLYSKVVTFLLLELQKFLSLFLVCNWSISCIFPGRYSWTTCLTSGGFWEYIGTRWCAQEHYKDDFCSLLGLKLLQNFSKPHCRVCILCPLVTGRSLNQQTDTGSSLWALHRPRLQWTIAMLEWSIILQIRTG